MEEDNNVISNAIFEKVLHDLANSIGNTCNSLELCEMRKAFVLATPGSAQNTAIRLLKDSGTNSKKLLIFFRYLFFQEEKNDNLGEEKGFNKFFSLLEDILYSDQNLLTISASNDLEQEWNFSNNFSKFALLLIFLCKKMMQEDTRIYLSRQNKAGNIENQNPQNLDQMKITITERNHSLIIRFIEVKQVSYLKILQSIIDKSTSHPYGQYAVSLMEKGNIHLEIAAV